MRDEDAGAPGARGVGGGERRLGEGASSRFCAGVTRRQASALQAGGPGHELGAGLWDLSLPKASEPVTLTHAPLEDVALSFPAARLSAHADPSRSAQTSLSSPAEASSPAPGPAAASLPALLVLAPPRAEPPAAVSAFRSGGQPPHLTVPGSAVSIQQCRKLRMRL
ncbi:hypothetical protein J1605_007237 [Eschrichtius robustus]|uniref:Uncharacterized protein n=1 Tax=Eschrichtius robustus TaxID=9764 RepID=A0AB34H4P7_ESCRO|nr:hypothetical protein J1605_007237 [Eschrichtius robustus]